MATRTANVMARIEPDIKEKAECILDTLGIPSSTVINALYKQIILTKSIPFSLSIPSIPMALDEMDKASYDKMMQRGLDEIKVGKSYDVDTAYNTIMRNI